MCKEELIKNEWESFLKGVATFSYVEGYLSSNGWIPMNLLNESIRVKLASKFNEFEINGDFIRPKKLNGIDDNNGWIKINSADDLPKEPILCNIFREDGNIDIGKYVGNDRWFLANNDYPHTTQSLSITHYMPIVKPQPPKY